MDFNFSVIKYKVTSFLTNQFGSMPNFYVAASIILLLCLVLYKIRKIAIAKGMQMDRDMVLIFVVFIFTFVILLN